MKAQAPIAVVALGGNALVRAGERGEITEQLRHIQEAVQSLPLLLDGGFQLAITHGNGPVVGHLLLQNEAARRFVPTMPLDVCDADSEGSIGYLTQQALGNVLGAGKGRAVVSLVTQVVVADDDPAFFDPTKPVGPFYGPDEALQLQEARGWVVREDAGRGWRRMVPSPIPLEIVESGPIGILLRHGVVVIAAGGGGIPVVRSADGSLRGVEAVIDKDRASALLATQLGASHLIILTAVDCVYRRFGSREQEPLRELRLAEASRLLKDGEFPSGSMGPKIESAVEFLRAGGSEVLITLPERLSEALRGDCGTRIIP